MAGLSNILDIAKRGLMTQQVGISVTNHNVSNAGTEGYSRQRVNFEPSTPLKEPYGFLGTGVTVGSIQRLREGFIDQQIRSVNNSLGQAAQQGQILSQIEAMLNEPSATGLGAMITGFFGSFQSLALNPEDAASRNAVVQSATALNNTFHRISADLRQLNNDLTPEISSRIDRINELTKEIWQSDQDIIALQAGGLDANDALDQRDNKVTELSKLVNIQVHQDSRGAITIDIGGTLVESRTGFTQLKVVSSGGQVQICSQDSSQPIDVNAGELGGILQMVNDTIPRYSSDLDTLAATIITRVNAVHSAGQGLGDPPPTGNDFFAGTDAATISLSAAVTASMNNIAASSDGSPGDNAVARSIADIANESLLAGDTETISQFYNSLVSDVGASVQTASNAEQSQNLVMTQFQNQMNSISGVSIDEEMVNLLKFQKGFDAAAKVITAVNSMYQSILDMI